MATKNSAPTLPLFAAFARAVERQVGRSYTFVLAVGVVIAWAATGPFFQWSDTWQLIINTGTTIVTFLMVFVIQNTQSRDTQALHLKLDELIRVSKSARNTLLDLEGLTEEDLKRLKGTFTKLASIPDNALLQEAVEDLDAAGDEIQGAKQKVAAIADEMHNPDGAR